MEIDEARTKSATTPEKWGKALSRAFKAVVVLRVTATRDFDTEDAGVGNATGFVVDKQRGIILTNRHVVQPGPVVAEATFLNGEEIPVYPLYRDPIHDFGFYRFDPAALRFMELDEIPLAPEAAAVGLEIRVVGNDSGEKLSVMAGTLARLDREAPQYDTDGYNDFNTFYMQAASGTKGGSSGSPVIDCHGQAVGLNAGGRIEGSTAFFLPLDRVVRALKIFQRCKDESEIGWQAADIPRGTLQMTLSHKGFDDARHIGLQGETEQYVRQAFPAETGILVIDFVVPGGPAEKHLEPGDIIVRVNGEIVTHFLKFETVLDDNVGKAIDIEVERGGVPLKVTMEVQDLHSITPDYFLEVSGGVIHPLSYQQARNYFFNCGLVYVATPGFMLATAGVPSHAIIKKLAGQETRRVEDFISIFSKLPRGSRVPLEYVTYEDRHRSTAVLVNVDRHEWYADPELYTRDDATGLWKRRPAMSCLSDGQGGSMEVDISKDTESIGSSDVNMSDSESNSDSDSTSVHSVERKRRRLNDQDEPSGEPRIKASSAQQVIEAPTSKDSSAEQVIAASLVMVEVHIPTCSLIDGVEPNPLPQTGVVIYHSETMGIVVVDRSTVPTSVADVMLAFSACQKEIPGQVIFVHPVHNYGLVAYDPAALGLAGITKVRAAALLPEPALNKGDSVYLVGLNRSLQTRSRISRVTNPLHSLNIGPSDIPQYRAMNMDIIELEADLGITCSGVLVDEQGRVQALWGSFYSPLKKRIPFLRGIPIYAVSQLLEKITNGTSGLPLLVNGIKISIPLVRILEVELYPTLLTKARSFGLSDRWISELANKDPLRRHVLRVRCCFAGSQAVGKVEQGDMVLAIDGKPITNYGDVENACQFLDESKDEEGNLRMTIFREGKEIEVPVGTDVRNGFGSTHMVNWCGCVLQETYLAVRSLGFWPEEGHGVYLSGSMPGSPAQRYGVCDSHWIVQVNDKRTPDLQSFINVTKDIGHGEFVRIKTVDLNGKGHVSTLKQDLHYWPTWELKFDSETAIWKRKTIKTLSHDF